MAAIVQIEVNQAVSLTTLAETESTVAGRVIENAGDCIRLEASTQAELGALVRLEWNDALALGRILEVRQGVINVEIEHVMNQVDALKRHNRIWWHTGKAGQQNDPDL